MSKTGKFLLWALIIGLTIYIIVKRKAIAAKLRELRLTNGTTTAGKISTAPKNNPNSIVQADVKASFNCDLCTLANMDPNSEMAIYDPTNGTYVMPNGREAIKCCTHRDSNCHCTAWVWKASSDCSTVPCGSAVTTQSATPQIYFNPQTNQFYSQLMNYSTPQASAGAGSSSATTATVVGK